MNNIKFVYSNICLTDNPLFSCNNWLNVDFYLSTIVLSILQTKKLYKDSTIEFIGDRASIELFNKLNLPFDVIKDDLETIKSYPKDFWALGKIFLHIWGAKNKIEWYDYIRNWLIKDYPSYYEIIQKLLKDNKLR